MTGEDTELSKAELLEMAADIVSAYVSNNEVKADSLPSLIESVYASVCLLYTSPSPRDKRQSRMPSSA